jgi:hypothetical protein
MHQRITPRIAELLENPYIVVTGRLKNFLYNTELKTNAPACMLRVYDNDLPGILSATSHYTRKGAGVKVQLGKFERREPADFDWHFTVTERHEDYHKMPSSMHTNYCNPLYAAAHHQDFTVISVEDSMVSIEDSWRRFIEAAERGEHILLEVNQIRKAGKDLSSGIVSTGLFGDAPGDEGFVSVYFWLAEHLKNGDVGSLLKLLGGLCKVIARGGTHKNGIVTTAIDYKHPDVWEYLNYPLKEVLGGSKKGIRFDEGILEDAELCELVVDKVNTESLMLEKIIDEDLYLNVCQGLFLKNKGSCLTTPANAGECSTPGDLVDALTDTTEFLCLIHNSWRKESNADSSLYLPLEEDRQIGVTWLGWANFLRQQGVSYECHVHMLRTFRQYREQGIPWYTADYNAEEIRGLRIASMLWLAYEKSADIARSYGLERAFGIEPTQRCYTDNIDLDGFTTCRNIDPPFGQYQQRNSEVHDDKIYYHGDVETVGDIGHDLHQLHWEEWQLIMDSTGLSHAASFDLYRYIDYQWFEDFVLKSPLKSTYYMQASKVNQSFLDKGNVLIACDDDDSCQVCGN